MENGTASDTSRSDIGREVAEPTVFDAVLTPHRSLSQSGFAIVMVVVGVIIAGLGTFFVLQGAWPIFGFLGLDLVLLYVAFRLSYRSGRLVERVHVTPSEVTVTRQAPGRKAESWTFNPFWLRVHMDDPPKHESQIRLTSHGFTLTIGGFLTPEERLDFAKALRNALAKAGRAA